MGAKEAAARIKINRLLDEAGWRFFDDASGPANIVLEPNTKITETQIDELGEDFETTKNGFIDFLLLDQDGRPLIVLEAKAESKNPLSAKEQARRYAREQNTRFVILSNGNIHYLWDLKQGNPSVITKFPSPGEIKDHHAFQPDPERLANEIVADDYIALTQLPDYANEAAWKSETERPEFIEKNKLRFLREYQERAVHAVQRAVKKGAVRFLFEMATGTGKTLTSAALIKLFLKTGNARRVLFLVDRIELEIQADKAFKALLKNDFTCVIYKEQRDDWRKADIVVTTVQSLLFNDKFRRFFAPTDFDLVISDEAHRSIGGKGSQLPQVKAELGAWLAAVRGGGEAVLYLSLGFAVEKARIAEGGEYDLSGERYRETVASNSEFPFVALGDQSLFKVESGGTPKSDIPEYWNGGVKWATLVDLPQDDFISEIIDTKRTISDAGLANSSAKVVPEQSVIVSTRATIGRIGINRVPIATNQGFKNVVMQDRDRVCPRYVALALTRLVPTMKAWATGGTFAEISKSKFCELQIPLPPLEVQREIVAEIEGYQKVIDGARAVLENYRPHIAIDSAWPMVGLKEIAQINPKKGELKELSDNTPVSFVPMAVLQENREIFSPTEVKPLGSVVGSYTYFRDDDVLVAKVTPCFENGKAGIAMGLEGGIGFGSSEFYIVRAGGQTTPRWLYHWLTTPDFRARATAKMTGTGGLQRVPRSVVEEEKVPLPPLETQQAIVAEIEAEQALVNANRDLIARFEKKIAAAVDRVWGGGEQSAEAQPTSEAA